MSGPVELPEAHAALVRLVRDEGRRVLATLTRTTGDLALAEDAVQDAVLKALQTWPRDGVPAEPRAWLTLTARRRAIDLLRREAVRGPKEAAAMDLGGERAHDEGVPGDSVVRDDQLRLVFTCCHPTLALDTQVALALRTLCGLTTAEVARALLVPEPTMQKRLVRAREKIRLARIPYRVRPTRSCPTALPPSRPPSTCSSTRATSPRASGPSPVTRSRTRRSGSPDCCASCYPTRRPSPVCWPCCSCSTPGGTRGWGPRTTWSCSPTRTAPAGAAT